MNQSIFLIWYHCIITFLCYLTLLPFFPFTLLLLPCTQTQKRLALALITGIIQVGHNYILWWFKKESAEVWSCEKKVNFQIKHLKSKSWVGEKFWVTDGYPVVRAPHCADAFQGLALAVMITEPSSPPPSEPVSSFPSF